MTYQAPLWMIYQELHQGKTVEQLRARGIAEDLIQEALDKEAEASPVGRVPSQAKLDQLYGGQRYEDMPVRPARRLQPVSVRTH
jgi:hypothetical protein